MGSNVNVITDLLDKEVKPAFVDEDPPDVDEDHEEDATVESGDSDNEDNV